MTRSAIALGLLDETEQAAHGEPRLSHSILPRPKTHWEREERRALASEVIAIDATFSASGSWPGTLPAKDEIVRAHKVTALISVFPVTSLKTRIHARCACDFGESANH
jgi:hypothetical protein